MDHIKQRIAEAKKEIQQMKNDGIYNAEHIQKVEQEKKKEIQALVKEYHQNNIYKLQDMKNEVIKKHDPTAIIEQPTRPETKHRMTAEERYKHLSEDWRNLQIEMDQRRGIYEYDLEGRPIIDGEVSAGESRDVKTRTELDLEASRQLLENRRMETEVKASRTADLKAEIETISKDKAGNMDRLNLVAAELRNRGENETADQLLDYMDAYNVKTPWQNDPDYIAAEKQVKQQELFIANDDLLFIDEDGDRPISINDIFEVDEEAEAEKRLKKEIEEYQEASEKEKAKKVKASRE